VIFDIRPPDRTYTLRERLLPRTPGQAPVANNWNCSYPNASTPGGTGSAPGGRFPCAWGPTDSETTPNADGRDFGNWFRPGEPERHPPVAPERPAPVVPAGPTPPTAGAAGTARVRLPRPTRARGCIGRFPRMSVSGTRIARVQIFANGRRVRTLKPRILQRRTRPRVMLPPGRHRVTARVEFEPGSATAPVRLTRTVRVCAQAAQVPRFTG
jgi:hypothetical protein